MEEVFMPDLNPPDHYRPPSHGWSSRQSR